MRSQNFCKNLQQINNHNNEAREHGFKLGLNHMSDWSYLEMQNLLITIFDQMNQDTSNGKDLKSSSSQRMSSDELPKFVDWRYVGHEPTHESNRVGPVGNQGACQCCWAFATVGLIEGQQQVNKSDDLVPLSVQQLIDCDSQGNNKACHGGHAHWALEYIQEEAGGLQSGVDYPLISNETGLEGDCRFDKSKMYPLKVKEVIRLTSGDEQELKRLVANYGPVAASINMDFSFLQYESGIYFNPRCKSFDLNHAILIVGYGSEPHSGEDYWIVKNSFGTKWGQGGFGLLSRNKDNHCGIASNVVYYK